MLCILWVQMLIYILSQALQWCSQLNVILDCVITESDWSCIRLKIYYVICCCLVISYQLFSINTAMSWSDLHLCDEYQSLYCWSHMVSRDWVEITTVILSSYSIFQHAMRVCLSDNLHIHCSCGIQLTLWCSPLTDIYVPAVYYNSPLEYSTAHVVYMYTFWILWDRIDAS